MGLPISRFNPFILRDKLIGFKRSRISISHSDNTCRTTYVKANQICCIRYRTSLVVYYFHSNNSQIHSVSLNYCLVSFQLYTIPLPGSLHYFDQSFLSIFKCHSLDTARFKWNLPAQIAILFHCLTSQTLVVVEVLFLILLFLYSPYSFNTLQPHTL